MCSCTKSSPHRSHQSFTNCKNKGMWTITAIGLLICLIGPFLRCIRGDAMSRLAALQGASTLCVMILLVLCEAYHRVPFVDLPLALALLSFGAQFVFARFLARWL